MNRSRSARRSTMTAEHSDLSNAHPASPASADICAVEKAAAQPDSSDTPSRLRPRQPKMKVVSTPVAVKIVHSKIAKKTNKSVLRRKVATKKEQKKKREDSEEPEGNDAERFPITESYTLPLRKAKYLNECFCCAEKESVPDIGSSIDAMEKAVINEVVNKGEEGEKMGEDPISAIADKNEEIGVKEGAKQGEKEDGEAAITANSDKTDEMEVDVKEDDVEQGEKKEGAVKTETNDETTVESAQTTDEKDEYIICAYPRCTQVMHSKCAEEFICGEYSPMQAQILFGVSGPVCPAHFCSHCYEERHKNASTFGKLVDCEDCMRSFHEGCMPAGCLISGEKSTQWGKRKTFVCHFHAVRKPEIAKKMRMKECIDCQEPFKHEIPGEEMDPNERRVNCTTCTSVFHLGCSFNVVKGPGAEQYKDRDRCSYCVTGSVIVPGQMVIAYCHISSKHLPTGAYPGVAVSLSDVPPKIIKSLGKANFGRVGWIPVKWIWDDAPDYYNLIPASRVQRMMIGSEKNLDVKDFINEWKQGEKNFKAPTYPLDHEAMMKSIKIITANVNTPGVVAKELTFSHETMICVCEADRETGIKCLSSSCLNRGMFAECTKECDAQEGVTCANRSLQREEEKKKVVVEVGVAPNGKGMGLFAKQKIKEQDFIIEYCGEVIDGKEKERREVRMAKLRSHDEFTYVMGLGRGFFVDARFKGSLARYANHSCDPNAVVTTVDVPLLARANKEKTFYQNKLKMVALRDIKEGEEITFNYGLKKSAGLAVDACRCGAEKCKGNIAKNGEADDDERLDEHAPVFLSSDDEEEGDEEDEVFEEEESKENKQKKKTASKRKSMNKSVKTEPMEPKKTVNKRRASKAFQFAEDTASPSTSTGKGTRRSIVVPKKKTK